MNDRYQVSTKNMKKGYYKVIDSITGEAVQSGLTIKSVAQSIASERNNEMARPIPLWSCPNCDRVNSIKHTSCPRCGRMRPDNV